MIFHGAFIFISLILNEARHLFLFTGPWISFFVKVVLNCFANFFYQIFCIFLTDLQDIVFFLLIYRIYVRFAFTFVSCTSIFFFIIVNIFSTALIVSIGEWNFLILVKSNLSIFSLFDIPFMYFV